MDKNTIPVCDCCQAPPDGELLALWSDLRLAAISTVMKKIQSGEECRHEAMVTDRQIKRCIFCGHTWAVS